MDKRQIIARYAGNQEDQMLLSHVADRLTTAEQRGIPASTAFLAPREQRLALSVLRACGCADPIFFGGVPDAERCICVYIPDYLDPEDWLAGPDSPICCLRASYAVENSLSHRDFLGALMGTGIKREATGDIYVTDGHCDFLVTREIAPYVKQNLLTAGRAHLSISELPLQQLQRPETAVKLQKNTVAALRLDSMVAAGFQVSRAKATSLVESGRVTVNYLECMKPDSTLKQGDRISVRGMGKCRLISVDGTTRKGRISITLEKYL